MSRALGPGSGGPLDAAGLDRKGSLSPERPAQPGGVSSRRPRESVFSSVLRVAGAQGAGTATLHGSRRHRSFCASLFRPGPPRPAPRRSRAPGRPGPQPGRDWLPVPHPAATPRHSPATASCDHARTLPAGSEQTSRLYIHAPALSSGRGISRRSPWPLLGPRGGCAETLIWAVRSPDGSSSLCEQKLARVARQPDCTACYPRRWRGWQRTISEPRTQIIRGSLLRKLQGW